MTTPETVDCELCPWSQPYNEKTAQRLLAQHRDRLHPELVPADDICDRLWNDHSSERDAITWAIEHVASNHGGIVDPNEVRSLIPPNVTPQLIGATYNVLRRRGVLEVAGETRSTDTKGRNVGKPATTYRLVGKAMSA